MTHHILPAIDRRFLLSPLLPVVLDGFFDDDGRDLDSVAGFSFSLTDELWDATLITLPASLSLFLPLRDMSTRSL